VESGREKEPCKITSRVLARGRPVIKYSSDAGYKGRGVEDEWARGPSLEKLKNQSDRGLEAETKSKYIGIR